MLSFIHEIIYAHLKNNSANSPGDAIFNLIYEAAAIFY